VEENGNLGLQELAKKSKELEQGATADASHQVQLTPLSRCILYWVKRSAARLQPTRTAARNGQLAEARTIP